MPLWRRSQKEHDDDARMNDAARQDDPTATRWQITLWAMVGIQFIMTMAFSFLSPIMPLFLPQLGVTSEAGIDLWAGILNGTTSFVAAFASPLWGRVADRRGRKLLRSEGTGTDPVLVGQRVAEKLRFLGADILLAEVAAEPEVAE